MYISFQKTKILNIMYNSFDYILHWPPMKMSTSEESSSDGKKDKGRLWAQFLYIMDKVDAQATRKTKQKNDRSEGE